MRYAPLLRREPALVAPALRAFLGPHGMRHPSPAVSGRAGYLFCRFVKVFSKGGELLPHLEEAVNAVGDLLAPAAHRSRSSRAGCERRTADALAETAASSWKAERMPIPAPTKIRAAERNCQMLSCSSIDPNTGMR